MENLEEILKCIDLISDINKVISEEDDTHE